MRSVRRSTPQITSFLLGVNMPDNVVGQSNHLVSGPFGHLSETFCLCLIFKRIAWKVNSCCMLTIIKGALFQMMAADLIGAHRPSQEYSLPQFHQAQPRRLYYFASHP